MKESYVLGNLDGEIERLEIQSSLFEPFAHHVLAKVGIKEGMSCIDVGCGSGSVTRLIAGMVGRTGRVIGLDSEDKYLQYCRGLNNTPRNVEFLRDDICESKLAENEAFDIVYCRLVFVHLKDAKKAVQSMKRLVKVGGVIIIQELDHAADSWLSYPRNKSLDTLRRTYTSLVRRIGGDPLAGRKLYKLLQGESLSTDVECYCPCVQMGREPYSSLGWRIAESLKPQILSYGLLSEKEYAKMYDSLIKLSRDTNAFVLYARFFSAVGRKPTNIID